MKWPTKKHAAGANFGADTSRFAWRCFGGLLTDVMKIAIAGKGGSGKTTIAGLLTRLIAQRGHEVWAIDADSNPNLGVTIGAPAELRHNMKPLEAGILKETIGEQGQRKVELALPPREVAQKFGAPVADRLTLLVMGTVDHAGEG